LEEKNRSYEEAPSGITGFGIHPLLLLDKAVSDEQYRWVLGKDMEKLKRMTLLDIPSVVKATSENPARTFGLENRGFIKPGYLANLLVVDRVESYEIDASTFASKAKMSPYDGIKCCIKPWKVFLRGKEVQREPLGKVLRSGRRQNESRKEI